MTSLKEYRKFTRLIRFMNTVVGFNSIIKNTGFTQKCLMFFSVVVTLIVTISSINACALNITNLTIFIKSMGSVGSSSTVTIKLFFTLYHRKRLQNLHTDLTSRFNNHLKQTEDVPELLCRLRQYSKPTYIYAGILISISLAYCTLPIVVLLKYGIHITILPTSYKPWIINTDIRSYITVIVIELYAEVGLIAVTTSVDALYWLYLAIICGELRVISKKYAILSTDLTNYQKNLRECVSRHCNLIRHTKNVEIIFGPIAMWLSVSSSLVICGQVLQVTQATSILQLIVPFLYTSIKLYQVFLFSRATEFVLTESENCLFNAFASIKYDKTNVSMKRNVVIITAQKPLTLQAFGFFRVSLELFTNVVNASISFFFMIQTFQEK